MDYVLICFAIGFVIFFHELGHFIAAKAVGIPVAVFSIGFGPRIWGRGYEGTLFAYPEAFNICCRGSGGSGRWSCHWGQSALF